MRWDRQARREGGRDAGRGSLPGILQELGVSQRPWVDGGWGCREAWRGGAEGGPRPGTTWTGVSKSSMAAGEGWVG